MNIYTYVQCTQKHMWNVHKIYVRFSQKHVYDTHISIKVCNVHKIYVQFAQDTHINLTVYTETYLPCT